MGCSASNNISCNLIIDMNFNSKSKELIEDYPGIKAFLGFPLLLE